MDLIKTIQEKDYASLKSYVSDKIASITSDKIITAKNTFIAKARGLTLEEYEKSLEDDEDEEDEMEESKKDKDGKSEKEDGDKEKATTDKDKEKYSAAS